jgi:hypothetical protein
LKLHTGAWGEIKSREIHVLQAMQGQDEGIAPFGA